MNSIIHNLKKKFHTTINIWAHWPIYFLAVFISACGNENYAPVVNGWQATISKQGMHTVQAGETLYSIAWRYGLDYREVAHANKMVPPYHLNTGQKIVLVADNRPKPKSVSSMSKPAIKKSHVVVAKKHRGEKWIWPIHGSIVKRFSLEGFGNKGIDIAAKSGHPVLASRGGEVVYSGNGLSGYGNLIIIKHDDEYLSAYAHNKINYVKEGEIVTKGQKIAEVGNTAAKRVMLHFEIRYHGKPVDPENYLG